MAYCKDGEHRIAIGYPGAFLMQLGERVALCVWGDNPAECSEDIVHLRKSIPAITFLLQQTSCREGAGRGEICANCRECVADLFTCEQTGAAAGFGSGTHERNPGGCAAGVKPASNQLA